MSNPYTSDKVLFFGLSNADLTTIEAFVKKGLMPNIGSFMKANSVGQLTVVDPPTYANTWTTINTGMFLHAHNLVHLTKPEEKQLTLNDSGNRKSKFYWEIISDQGLKAHQFNAPFSYPAQKINGNNVSDYFFQELEVADKEGVARFADEDSKDKFQQFFNSSKSEAKELLQDFYTEEIPNHLVFKSLKKKIHTFLSEVIALEKMAFHVIESGDWNSLSLYYNSLAQIVFAFTPYSFHKNSSLSKQLHICFKDTLHRCYTYLDMSFGKILAQIDESTPVFLVSQTGYLPFHSWINKIKTDKANNYYEYSLPGFVMLRSKAIEDRKRLYGLGGQDIGPTLIALLDLPYAQNFNGSLILEEESAKAFTKSVASFQDEAFEIQSNTLITEEQVIERLNDLNYIDGKSFSRTYWHPYLEARKQISMGLVDNAISLFEKIIEEEKTNNWVHGRLAGCFLAKQDLEKTKLHLDRSLELKQNVPEFLMLKGRLLLGDRKQRSAHKAFQEASENIGKISGLHYQCAQFYAQMQIYDKALEEINLEIKNSKHPAFYLTKAQYLMELKQLKKAIEPLEEVVALQNKHVTAWYMMGDIYYKMQEWQKAADALENAKINFKYANNKNIVSKTRQMLIEIYSRHLKQPEKVQEMADNYKKTIASKGVMTVVSGLPRSGTSMMMQMLVNGGMEAFTDDKRAADENNKKGYYEHDAIKALGQNVQILQQVGDKVVKIISHLLEHLPVLYQYKIVFMDREIDEVMNSQHKMLGRLGKERGEDKENSISLTNTFEESRRKAISWAVSNKSYVDILVVKYSDIIADPINKAKEINAFLGGQLNEIEMAKVVDPTLYREKSEKVN